MYLRTCAHACEANTHTHTRARRQTHTQWLLAISNILLKRFNF